MLGTFDFNPGPWRKPVSDVENPHPLRARVRQSAAGARIEFSDGRSAWMLREPHVAESTFLAAVTAWVKLRGAESLEIFFEDNLMDVE